MQKRYLKIHPMGQNWGGKYGKMGCRKPESVVKSRLSGLDREHFCYTYYVYQSTPFDLYGTPDFDSIENG